MVSPLLEKIQEVTEPLQPIIDIVTTPLPVLSDLGLEITLLDIAKATGKVSPGFVSALETILDVVSIINSIEISTDGALLIPLGDFTIYEKEQFAGLLGAGGALAGMDFNLGSGNFDLGGLARRFLKAACLPICCPKVPLVMC